MAGGRRTRGGDQRRTATAVAVEEDPVRWRRSHVAGTLRAYRDPEFCLAYARTNPSICASFLPRMATTSFQGRSRRLPLAPPSTRYPLRRRFTSSLAPVAADFSRAPNSAPSDDERGRCTLHRHPRSKKPVTIRLSPARWPRFVQLRERPNV